MDESGFHVLEKQAAGGDAGAMVDLALELRHLGESALAIEWLRRAADAGQVRAMAALARMYSTGEGTEKDDVQFLMWLHRAAESGDPGSMMWLAKVYHDGTSGLTKDPKQMLRWLLKAVNSGSSEAMHLLSLAYANGVGVLASKEKSFTWLRRAAKSGNVPAMIKLADRYRQNTGLEQDLDAYFQWTKRAAERGDPCAMFNLAIAYDTGLGTDVDKLAFFEWMKRAANQGQREALFSLAMAYRDGVGVRPDQDEYQRLLVRAAAADEPRALNNLAINYLYGLGVEADRLKYLQLLTEAARAGEPNAMFNLAHAYRDGEGAAKDPEAAIDWLEKAAKREHLSAMVELSAYYYRCALVDRKNPGSEQHDRGLRFEPLARQAAEFGDGRAMYLMTMAHRTGMGVPSSPNAARSWLERSALARFPPAMAELAMMYRDGVGYEKNDKSFFDWIRRTAESGDATAMTSLALAYHDGRGTNRDLVQCRTWLERADTHGDSNAIVLLGLLQLEEDKQIPGEALGEVSKRFMDLQSEIRMIKEAHVVRDAPEGIGYFTTFKALVQMLSVGENSNNANPRVRLYNAAYLRDKQEGNRLLEMTESPSAQLLREFFPSEPEANSVPTISWTGHEYSVYVGSFTCRTDHFDLWRTFGEDGVGCCVVTPLSAFPQQDDHLRFNLAHEAQLTESGKLPEKWQAVPGALKAQLAESYRRRNFIKPVLYRVEYSGTTALAVLERLQPHLEAIAAFKKSLRSGSGIVDTLVRFLVSDILYLFRDDVYQAEQEARMVVACDLASDYVKCDTAYEPSRLYVETEPFLFSEKDSEIIIGPKVNDPAAVYLDLRYRLARCKWTVSTQVINSSVQYR